MHTNAKYEFGDLTINGSDKTPSVSLKRSGIIELKGKSYPENGTKFYEALKDWIKVYVDSPAKKTVFNMSITYMNSSSAVILLGVLKQLAESKTVRESCQVNWYFESGDSEMHDLGQIFQNSVDLPIEIIEIDEI